MTGLYDVLKYLAVPPANFLLALVAGLLVLLCGYRRPGMGLIVLGTAAGYLLATPVVAGALARMTEKIPPANVESLLAGHPEAIVVLAAGVASYAPEYGGATVDDVALRRLRYAARLWRVLHLPTLVSGGRAPGVNTSFAALMKTTLEMDFAVPVQWIEDQSRDTHENAVLSADILRASKISRIVLVTDAAHMARATAEFERAGVSVAPAPTAFSARSSVLPVDYLPRFSALRDSYYATYELLAQVWYAVRYGPFTEERGADNAATREKPPARG